MSIHVVEQGECLSSISRRYGLNNWRKIYDHPENADFKRLRPDPNLIYPGERLFIPDTDRREDSGGTEQRHRFRLREEQTFLRLRLIDRDGNAISNRKCRLDIEGLSEEVDEDAVDEEDELVTDEEGAVEIRIPPTAENGTMVIEIEDENSDNVWLWKLKLGHLDPIETTSGVQGRLLNLAFDAGWVDGINGPRTKAAVRAFQKMYGLRVDGIVGSKTRAKLKDVHDEPGITQSADAAGDETESSTA